MLGKGVCALLSEEVLEGLAHVGLAVPWHTSLNQRSPEFPSNLPQELVLLSDIYMNIYISY